MDFDAAISAHSAWKMKLASYLKKPDKSLDAKEVASDHKCPLGHWIHGDGSKHAPLAEFQALKSEHARFHKAAADVVAQADAGKDVTEEIAIGGTSEFAMASTKIVGAIIAMRRKVG